MVGQGKLIGGALIAFGVIVALVVTLYGFSNDELTGGSRALLAGCGIIIGVILAGAGVFFFASGRTETTQYAEVEKEKGVLNAVATRGEVRISEIALEQNVTVDQIRKYVYDLVGKGLFTGYVDWKGGRLISQDAASLSAQIQNTGKCPNCGAPLTLGGKGFVKCEYCGAEFFLAPTPGATPGGTSGSAPAPSAS